MNMGFSEWWMFKLDEIRNRILRRLIDKTYIDARVIYGVLFKLTPKQIDFYAEQAKEHYYNENN